MRLYELGEAEGRVWRVLAVCDRHSENEVYTAVRAKYSKIDYLLHTSARIVEAQGGKIPNKCCVCGLKMD